MGDKAFIDTNVLVYLYSWDEKEKQQAAYNAIENHDCIISTQIINEFCNVCIKKLGLSALEVRKAINEILAIFPLTLVDKRTINYAIELYGKYKYSYYDSLVISSALLSGCDYLLTEDMSNGQEIDEKITITNIFKK